MVPAAQYVRMSTERQDYSLEFQTATNAAFALAHGYEIVRTYTDAGLSGLTIEKRDGLKALIAEVLGGSADYRVVLVYDVSRWGRFQNPDQAAHYEFLCAEAGVRVEYCAEPFDNDGSPTSTLIKHLKRAMAAEYSRDLSQKVMRAQRGLLAQGFWMWGDAPYGYRREVIDKEGRPCPVEDGSLWRKKQGVHTRLTLGSTAEIETVRRVFRRYLRGASIASIARELNRDGVAPARAEVWSAKRVGDILRNETYMGRLVGGRRSTALGARRATFAPLDTWTVVDGAVPQIIAPKDFAAAQRRRGKYNHRVTRSEALLDLRRIADEHGTLSQGLLDRHGRWSRGLYRRCLGTLEEMRLLVGVPAPTNSNRYVDRLRRANVVRLAKRQIWSDEQLLDGARQLLERAGRLTRDLITNEPSLPNACVYSQRFGGMAEVYRRVGFEPQGVQLLNLQSPQKRARPALPLMIDSQGRARLMPED